MVENDLEFPLSATLKFYDTQRSIKNKKLAPITFETLELDEIMKKIQSKFEEFFPEYLETGFKTREVAPSTDQSLGFAICGENTVLKLIDNFSSFKTTNSICDP